METQKNENEIQGTEKQGSLAAFAASEAGRLDAEFSEAMRDLGYSEFLKVPEGTTEVEFTESAPRNNEKYENRIIFHVISGGREYDWSVNLKSPLYREIIAFLKDGIRKVSVTRIGQGMDTRYSVRAV